MSITSVLCNTCVRRRWLFMAASVFFLVVAIAPPVSADGCLPPHDPPGPGEWVNPINGSHNHNTTIGFDMENILAQPAGTQFYDGYGSWYVPAVGGVMSFHASLVAPGLAHGDAVRFGHGFIPEDQPVTYQYSARFLAQAPLGALPDVDLGFEEWDREINTNANVFRRPGTTVGFHWERGPMGIDPLITVNWADAPYGDTIHEPPIPGAPGPTQNDLFEDLDHNGQYDSGEPLTRDVDNDGLYDTVSCVAWVIPDANPTMEFFKGYYEDGVLIPNDWFFGGGGGGGASTGRRADRLLHSCPARDGAPCRPGRPLHAARWLRREPHGVGSLPGPHARSGSREHPGGR
jgi:hypothetical protein